MKAAGLRILKKFGLESPIALNSFWLLSAESLARIINLLLGIVLARYLKAEGTGLLTFAINYVVLFSIIGELGISRVAVREIARRPESAGLILGHVGILRMVMCAVMAVAIWGSLILPGGSGLHPQERLVIFIWTWSLIFQMFRRNAETAFQALGRQKYQALFLLLNRLVAAVGILAVIVCKGGIAAVAVTYVAADCLDAISAAWFVRFRLQRPVYSLAIRPISAMVIAGFPFALQLFAGTVYYYIDTVLLKYLFRADYHSVLREMGWYGKAYTPVLTLLFIPISVCATLYPPLSRAWAEKDLDRIKSLFRYSYNLLLLAGTPLAVIFFMFRSEFILVIFGEDFRSAIPMLAVIIWTLPFIFLTGPLTNLLAAADRQMLATLVAFANVAFNIVLNWYLIPMHGGKGAAFSTAATEAFCLLSLFIAGLYVVPGLIGFGRPVAIVCFHVTAILLALWFDGSGVLNRFLFCAAYLAIAGGVARWLTADRRKLERTANA